MTTTTTQGVTVANRGGERDYWVQVLDPEGEVRTEEAYGRLRLEGTWVIFFLDDRQGGTFVSLALPSSRVLRVWTDDDEGV
jgi:hypothetical protein